MIISLINKIKFDLLSDRIGPDLPFTHWILHLKKWGILMCKKKFKKFGENAELRFGSYAINCSNIKIGNNVVIRPGTMLFATKEGGIVIEDDVLLGSCVHIYVSDHAFSNPSIPIINQGYSSAQDVLICKGAWIGANVTILKGVTVGENSVVAAGAVLVKNVPPHTLVGGVPAKVIKQLI